ncbi:methylated-DNA--[protein]-cysteine S-methyltransferase [Microbacterium sp. P06]|uniref:methylated-DNA--[protein]-cysteine S-methyltransferase n=1 Tax=Microbacterium sp. P06 TaxID=3366949 RepID=UPI0037466CE9
MTRFTTAWHPTPVGDVLLAFADGGDLVALHVEHDERTHAIEQMARRLPGALEHDDDAAEAVAAQLDEYFTGARRTFDLRLDWRLARGFTRTALEAVCEIPYGETAAYGEVAMLAGNPRAARAVGTACRTTPFSIVVPVHRVVRADGSLGEYGAHPEVKSHLLDLEREAAGG